MQETEFASQELVTNRVAPMICSNSQLSGYAFQTKVGWVRASFDLNGHLKTLHFTRGCGTAGAPGPSNPLQDAAVRLQLQLDAYLDGSLQNFDVSIRPVGSDFQMRVWAELRRIPYGQTTTYGEIAMRIGQPKAARAIGRANAANPIAIIVPCHRVIEWDGRLGGYSSGTELKRALLELESGIKRPFNIASYANLTGCRDGVDADRLFCSIPI